MGKGKGGYSYLAEKDNCKYVLKQIHHEPCDYYQFGDKIQAEIFISQVKEMCKLLYPENINIDYFPTNFISQNGVLYYIDFECNEYTEEWNFENWGIKYWSKTSEFIKYMNAN